MAIDRTLSNPTTTRFFRVDVRKPDVSNQEITDMIRWAKNPEVKGYFTHRFEFNVGMIFMFSDENVAFEFKIRWG